MAISTCTRIVSQTYHPEIVGHKQHLGAFREEGHSLLCGALFVGLVEGMLGEGLHPGECFGMISQRTVKRLGDRCVRDV